MQIALTCLWLVEIENSKEFFIAAGEQVISITRKVYTLHNVFVGKGMYLVTIDSIPHFPGKHQCSVTPLHKDEQAISTFIWNVNI